MMSDRQPQGKGVHWHGARLLNIVSAPLVRATRGNTRVGHARLLQLTTTGRRTGLPRTVHMPSLLKDGDSFVLVASYGGARQHPAWYHNLTANPEVRVVVDGREVEMLGRVADPEEREKLWPKVVRRSLGGYWVLQLLAPREVPLVILEPLQA